MADSCGGIGRMVEPTATGRPGVPSGGEANLRPALLRHATYHHAVAPGEEDTATQARAVRPLDEVLREENRDRRQCAAVADFLRSCTSTLLHLL